VLPKNTYWKWCCKTIQRRGEQVDFSSETRIKAFSWSICPKNMFSPFIFQKVTLRILKTCLSNQLMFITGKSLHHTHFVRISSTNFEQMEVRVKKPIFIRRSEAKKLFPVARKTFRMQPGCWSLLIESEVRLVFL